LEAILNRECFNEWIHQIHQTTEVEIDCDRLQKLLPAYVDAELAGVLPVQANHVKKHLAHCPDCAADYVGLHHVACLEMQGQLPELEELLPVRPHDASKSRPEPTEGMTAVAP
jgi:predicted anti-sigma-YlaC factor YlaD